jgi:hypothetical protein
MIGAFLWSTSGIGMLMHYCEGKLKHTSLYGITEQKACHHEAEMSCHADQPKACCAIMAKLQESEHKGCSAPEKDCCDDQFFFLKIAKEFLSLSSTDVDLDIEKQFASHIEVGTYSTADFFQPHHPPFREHAPPSQSVSILVLHQQFRL